MFQMTLSQLAAWLKANNDYLYNPGNMGGPIAEFDRLESRAIDHAVCWADSEKAIRKIERMADGNKIADITTLTGRQ